MTGGKYIGCSDCGGGIVYRDGGKFGDVKFKRDGDSLIPDVRKTQYAMAVMIPLIVKTAAIILTLTI